MNIYVGNLPYKVTDAELRQLFEAHGEVTSATVIADKYTGQSKGFGFVEMPNKEQATAAIEQNNNKDFEGRKLRVNEARPRGEGGGGFRDR
jgi:RNA recognition motif-containing protein